MALTWTGRTSASDSDWRGVAWNGTVFAAVAFGGEVMTSPDGTTWTSRTGTAGSGWRAIAWNGTVFCAIRSGISMTSPDGITWTAGTTNLNWATFDSIAWNGSVFCITDPSSANGDAGGTIMTSPTGAVWTQQDASTVGNTYHRNSIAAGGGIFVAVSDEGYVMSSPDGVTWTDRAMPSSANLTTVAWTGARFVALASSGHGYTSLTGESAWTALGLVVAASAAGTIWRGAVGSSGAMVAVRSGSAAATGLVSSSTDGLTWESDTSAGTNNWRAVAFGNGGYVAVANTGTGNRVMTAPVPVSSAILTAPVATLVSNGGGLAQLVAPVATVTAYGGGRAQLTAPAGRLAHAAHIVANSPVPTLSATAHDSSGENSLTCSAPSPTLNTYGGGNSALNAPSPALSGTATTTIWGAAALTSPSPLVVADGRVSNMAAAYLRTTEPYKLAAYSGAVCSITLTGKATLLASGTAGGVGQIVLTAPLFELTASGEAQNYGSADLLAPSPQMGATAQAWLMAPGATLTAIGHAVVAVSYEAYAVNLNHKPKRGVEPIDEVTRYTNFPFTQIVRYKNSYFGVAADGLYLLEGTTDAGTAVPYTVRTAVSDFDAAEKKTVLSAYFGGRIGPDMAVTLYAGDNGQEAYAFTTPRGQSVQTHRQKFARGVKDRYYAFGVAGTGELQIDSVELEVNKLTRRI